MPLIYQAQPIAYQPLTPPPGRIAQPTRWHLQVGGVTDISDASHLRQPYPAMAEAGCSSPVAQRMGGQDGTHNQCHVRSPTRLSRDLPRSDHRLVQRLAACLRHLHDRADGTLHLHLEHAGHHAAGMDDRAADLSDVQFLRVVDPPLRHAPALENPAVPGGLFAPHPDASPVLHRTRNAFRRPSRLARDVLPTLFAGRVHADVDPGRTRARLDPVGRTSAGCSSRPRRRCT